jgi:hypothetical protein
MDDSPITAQPGNPDAASRADYVRRLIASRCSDALTDDEIERASANLHFQDGDGRTLRQDIAPVVAMVDREVGEQILMVLEALGERMGRIEAWVATTGQA